MPSFLLDESVGDHALHDALADAGHDAVLVLDELGGGADDLEVLSFACKHERIVITCNGADFALLAEETPAHPGILLLYHDEASPALTTPDIVRALANVAAAYPRGIAGMTLVLNAYASA